MKSTAILYVYIFLLFLILDNVIVDVEGTVFSFNRYPYKKKQKNEKRYKNLLSRCEQDQECINLSGLEKTKCLRQCLSPECYQELYSWDELEEGEIDVRLTSYKGCVLQKESQRK